MILIRMGSLVLNIFQDIPKIMNYNTHLNKMSTFWNV